jgi:predicted cupin superfamily sugar epimerase
MLPPAQSVPAQTVIQRFGLQPHPEGGWYRETWRGPPGPDGRSVGTAILFLLQAGERSHWHRVDAAEHWIFNAGDPLEVSVAGEDGAVHASILGPAVWEEHAPHVLVPPGAWQAAAPLGAWSLVTCTVSPGFDFAGFTLAPPGWEPGHTESAP